MDRIWQYTEIQWNIDSHIRWLKSEMAFQEINWIQSLLAANFHELGGIYGNEFWFLVFILVGMTLSWVGRCMSPLDVNVKWKKQQTSNKPSSPSARMPAPFFQPLWPDIPNPGQCSMVGTTLFVGLVTLTRAIRKKTPTGQDRFFKICICVLKNQHVYINI